MTLFFFFSFSLLHAVILSSGKSVKYKPEHCLPYVSLVSTAYVDKIVFQELGIPVLVSLVVKRAVGQGSNNLYGPVCPQDSMPDQYHQESLEYQMRNCFVQKERLVYLCQKCESESPVFQINIFEHPCHVENYFLFPFQVFSLHLLHHCKIYTTKKKKHFEIRPLFLVLLGIFLEITFHN